KYFIANLLYPVLCVIFKGDFCDLINDRAREGTLCLLDDHTRGIGQAAYNGNNFTFPKTVIIFLAGNDPKKKEYYILTFSYFNWLLNCNKTKIRFFPDKKPCHFTFYFLHSYHDFYSPSQIAESLCRFGKDVQSGCPIPDLTFRTRIQIPGNTRCHLYEQGYRGDENPYIGSLERAGTKRSCNMDR